jgi:hypothetical protein
LVNSSTAQALIEASCFFNALTQQLDYSPIC